MYEIEMVCGVLCRYCLHAPHPCMQIAPVYLGTDMLHFAAKGSATECHNPVLTRDGHVTEC
jgi:hypothetical protein